MRLIHQYADSEARLSHLLFSFSLQTSWENHPIRFMREWQNGQRTASPRIGEVCAGWWYSRWQDTFNLRSRMQQACVAVSTLIDPCADGVGHRSISNLQRRKCRCMPWCLGHFSDLFKCLAGARTIMGSGWRGECVTASVGHIRRPRQRSALRIWSVRCGPFVLFYRQSGFAAELLGNVVSRDTSLLSRDTSHPGWLQKRFALHVQRRSLFVVFRRPKPVDSSRTEKRSGDAGRGACRRQGIGHCLLWDECVHLFRCERSVRECHPGGTAATATSAILDDESEASQTSHVAGETRGEHSTIFDNFKNVIFRPRSGHQSRYRPKWPFWLGLITKTCSTCWKPNTTPIWSSSPVRFVFKCIDSWWLPDRSRLTVCWTSTSRIWAREAVANPVWSVQQLAIIRLRTSTMTPSSWFVVTNWNYSPKRGSFLSPTENFSSFFILFRGCGRASTECGNNLNVDLATKRFQQSNQRNQSTYLGTYTIRFFKTLG